MADSARGGPKCLSATTSSASSSSRSGARLAPPARILGRQEDPGALHDELARVAGHAGFDPERLRAVSEDTLHLRLSPTGEVEPARCWLMAELLYPDGLQALAEERAADAHASRDGG